MSRVLFVAGLTETPRDTLSLVLLGAGLSETRVAVSLVLFVIALIETE